MTEQNPPEPGRSLVRAPSFTPPPWLVEGFLAPGEEVLWARGPAPRATPSATSN